MPKVDLAFTDAEQKEMAADSCCPMPEGYKGPKYPWGLQLTFEDSVLEKLGKTAADFKIGEALDVPVTLRVTGLRATEREDGDMRQSVDLVMIAIDTGAKSEEEKARTLFE